MSIMAQEEKEVSLLETALAGLASDQETEEEVKEGTDITGVDETKVYKVWEEDEEDQQEEQNKEEEDDLIKMRKRRSKTHHHHHTDNPRK